MKNHIRVDGKLLMYHVKKRKDASAAIWVGPYIVEATHVGRTDELRSKYGSTSAGGSDRMVIPAPMPGLVNRVDVKVGASVQAGDPLIVLEAMKMENVIRAGIAGKITKLNATPGKSVDKGEELVIIQAVSDTPG